MSEKVRVPVPVRVIGEGDGISSGYSSQKKMLRIILEYSQAENRKMSKIIEAQKN